MSLAMVTLGLLLQAAPPSTDAADRIGWSVCSADATGPSGKVRYLSDPFEGESDDAVAGSFREYVDRSYSKTRGTSGYTVACRFYPTLAAAGAALKAEAAAKGGAEIVTTAWRFHFE